MDSARLEHVRRVAKSRLHILIRQIDAAVRHPGSMFFRRKKGRLFYKRLCSVLLASKIRRLNAIRLTLPDVPPSLKLSRELGYLVVESNVSHQVFRHLAPLLECCQDIIQKRAGSRVFKGSKKRGKMQLHDVVSELDVEAFPEFLSFGTDPVLLAIVADYLETLPVLFDIRLWRSVGIEGPPDNSQLYHNDHEDIRQIKIFVHVSDVDAESGPLTVIPANMSEAIRGRLGYVCRLKIPDDRICPFLPKGAEHTITGLRGTIAFVDTSQVLHFGSRMLSRERYVAVFQYVSPTCLYVNPLNFSGLYRFRHIARRAQNEAGQAVLAGTFSR